MNAYRLSLIILVIGGLDLGLIGLLNFNVIGALFGGFARILYLIVGAAAVYIGVKTFIYKQ